MRFRICSFFSAALRHTFCTRSEISVYILGHWDRREGGKKKEKGNAVGKRECDYRKNRPSISRCTPSRGTSRYPIYLYTWTTARRVEIMSQMGLRTPCGCIYRKFVCIGVRVRCARSPRARRRASINVLTLFVSPRLSYEERAGERARPHRNYILHAS